MHSHWVASSSREYSERLIGGNWSSMNCVSLPLQNELIAATFTQYNIRKLNSTKQGFLYRVVCDVSSLF